MEKLIEKMENLKSVLDDNKQVKEIIEMNKEIMQDKELLSLIKEYNITKSEKIKEKIMNNQLFKDYKKKETDLNILILEINQKLKQISDKGECSL